MRPRKVILLVDSWAETRGLRAFVLDCHGFKVLQRSGDAALLKELAQGLACGVDLLITTDDDFSEIANEELIYLAKTSSAELQALVLVTGPRDCVAASVGADAWVEAKGNTRDFLELVRTMTARKRGPKPRPRPAQEAECAPA